MVAVSVLTCEKFTIVRDIAFSCFLCPFPSACDHNALSPICIDVLITWPTVRLMFTVCFLYPRISFWMHFHPICIDVLITWPTLRLMFTVCFLYPRILFWPLSAINTLSHYAEINSVPRKKHTLMNSRRHFCLVVWLLELTFFSDRNCQNSQIPVCKGDNPNFK